MALPFPRRLAGAGGVSEVCAAGGKVGVAPGGVTGE